MRRSGPATPTFGRRRRRWPAALAVLAVVGLGTTAAALAPWSGTDAVDVAPLATEPDAATRADEVVDPLAEGTPPPTDGPTRTEAPPPDGPTGAPADGADHPAPAADAPTGRATAAGDVVLSAPPAVEVASSLPDRGDGVPRRLRPLARRLDAVLAGMAEPLAGAEVAVAVRDATGRRVLDHGADAPLLPASTMKTVTATTVLSTLGPDHRFTTAVEATGPVEDGVLRGDLVVRGGGDPVLTTDDYRTHVYPSRPSTSIEDLADAVVDAGVRVVTGDLLADGTGWSSADLAAGWRDRYLSEQDARHITQLTVDAGLDVAVDIPEDAPVQVVLHPSADPVARTAAVLASALAERGVAVRGRVAAARLPVPAGEPVAAVASPPVSELLAFTLQRSDNHLADTMLRAAAEVATGDGSWAAAARTATATLDELGVDPAGLRVADGSGLSRLDRVSAGQLADLDAVMSDGPAAATWSASLAVAGESGTLRNRLLGTPGQGRFLGKTGTLDDVKAVVGHVLPADGGDGRLHLAVVANGVPAGGQWAVTVLMDRLQLEMVDWLDGCRTTYDEEQVPTRTCGDA